MTAMLNNTELSADKVRSAVSLILDTLGQPQTEAQRMALEAYRADDHATVKRLSTVNLNDPYIKALGYLGSAMKLTPNTDTILSESARSAVDWVKEKTLSELSAALGNALSGGN
jgi:hypothetical protein